MTTSTRFLEVETHLQHGHTLRVDATHWLEFPFAATVKSQGTLALFCQDYPRSWHRYYTTAEKAAFLYTQLFHWRQPYEGRPEVFTRELRASSPAFALLCRVIERRTGVKVQAYDEGYGQLDEGIGMLGLDLFQEEARLAAFLFGAGSFIETGVDGEQPPLEIASDRGRVFYYQHLAKEPHEDWVVVSGVATTLGSPVQLASGRVLEPKADDGLWERLRREGTVTYCAWESQGLQAPDTFASAPRSLATSMQALAKAGWAFSESVGSSAYYGQDQTQAPFDRVRLTWAVPPDLATCLNREALRH